MVILTHGTIHTETDTLKNGFLKITDGRITEIGPMDSFDTTQGAFEISIPKGSQVLPGMIDLHIHGVGGVDVMDATPHALATMAALLPREGTTSFLATTLTQAPERIEAALSCVAYHMEGDQKGRAECLGIHLEGPFISAKKKGAQPAEFIIPPCVKRFQRWQKMAQNQIRIVTLAPEEAGGLELIRYLQQVGVIASIGHSDASYSQCIEAIEAGASHVTHLYHGMRSFHHREPGVVGAAFLRDELQVEVIADGVHSTPEAIQLAFQQITSQRMVLITDSIRAKCLQDGIYELGGQQVHVKGSKARLVDGTLAGSLLRMSDTYQKVKAWTGYDIRDWMQMTSINPAKELGVFARKGSIAKDKDADIVVIDEKGEVWLTLCRGEVAFWKEE